MTIDLLAAAGAGAAAAPPAWISFLPIIGMIAIFWFLIIRPQMKRQKEHQQKIAAVKKGDQVVTAGGLVGKVVKVGDGYATLEVAHRGDEAIEMQVQKQAIQTLLPKGTIKAI